MITGLTFGFAVAAVVLVLFAFYSDYLRSAWKRREGFADLNVPNSYFVPKVTPSGYDDITSLSPGGALNQSTEKLVESAKLVPMTNDVAEGNWAKMTSETCYRSDIGESLKKTRNYLQRTNNYPHIHPDSCSAPNHEFVGTFYTPFDGVGRTPASGTKYPPSTQHCPT